MKKYFSYYILQYRHSAFISEAINIGILFLFPEEKEVHFELGDLVRVKRAYPNFDTSIVHKILLNISNKAVGEYKGLFNPFDIFPDLDNFKKTLLREDDSSLVFLPVKNSAYPFNNIKKVIEQYSQLLLVNHSGNVARKRHDEKFISKSYLNNIINKDKNAVIALKKDIRVESNGVKLDFDFSWKNGKVNLVKPVSFDYLDEHDIQHKSITYFGYLLKLKGYALERGINYHLIVAKPQQKNLFFEYEKALDIIKSSESPTRIITEESLESYSEETANYLRLHINEETN